MPGQAFPHRDERELLLAYIDQQRDGIRYAAYGLTDEQARLTPTAGTLSIGGLVTHVTAMERGWIDLILQRPAARRQARPRPRLRRTGFRLGPDRTLAEALAALDAVAAETDGGRSPHLARRRRSRCPKGVPWFPDDIDAWSVRWVLLHLDRGDRTPRRTRRHRPRSRSTAPRCTS